jgi:hypothetical protein
LPPEVPEEMKEMKEKKEEKEKGVGGVGISRTRIGGRVLGITGLCKNADKVLCDK